MMIPFSIFLCIFIYLRVNHLHTFQFQQMFLSFVVFAYSRKNVLIKKKENSSEKDAINSNYSLYVLEYGLLLWCNLMKTKIVNKTLMLRMRILMMYGLELLNFQRHNIEHIYSTTEQDQIPGFITFFSSRIRDELDSFCAIAQLL